MILSPLFDYLKGSVGVQSWDLHYVAMEFLDSSQNIWYGLVFLEKAIMGCLLGCVVHIYYNNWIQYCQSSKSSYDEDYGQCYDCGNPDEYYPTDPWSHYWNLLYIPYVPWHVSPLCPHLCKESP
jgi:hypothetical protein